MMRKKITGIYKITNKINGKIYVGQSIDIYKRWLSHERSTNTSNSILHRAFRKYGIDNFLFEIIERCNNGELNDREVYWISELNTYVGNEGSHGYNMTTGGDSLYEASGIKIISKDGIFNSIAEAERFYNIWGIGSWVSGNKSMPRKYYYDLNIRLFDTDVDLRYPTLPKEELSKISSEAMKKALENGSVIPTYKRVVCLNTKKVYSSLEEACNEYGFSKSNLSSGMKSKYKRCGKDLNGNSLFWMLESEYSNMSSIDVNYYIELDKNKMRGKNNKSSKSIICLTTMVEFNCLAEAAMEYNVDPSSIAKACKKAGKPCGKSHDGNRLIWCDKDEYDENINIHELQERANNHTKRGNNGFSRGVRCKNNGLEFECIKDASEYFGINSNCICKSCKRGTACGKLKLGVEYYFEYIN